MKLFIIFFLALTIHCVVDLQFVYPLAYRGASRLLPVGGIFIYLYKHSHAALCMDISFPLRGVNSQGDNCWILWEAYVELRKRLSNCANVVVSFCFPPARRVPVVPHPCQHWGLLVFWIWATLGGRSWYLVLICKSLMTQDVKHLFGRLFATCIIFFPEVSIQVFYLLNWVIFFLSFNLSALLEILISSPKDILPFHFLSPTWNS